MLRKLMCSFGHNVQLWMKHVFRSQRESHKSSEICKISIHLLFCFLLDILKPIRALLVYKKLP